jgi:hypothetical protein
MVILVALHISWHLFHGSVLRMYCMIFSFSLHLYINNLYTNFGKMFVAKISILKV